MPQTSAIPQPTPVERERFDAKYSTPSVGCWEWLAAKADGYGRFKFRGTTMRAHRLLFTWTYPEIDITDQELDHFACDNRGCVRPDHLRPVSTRENLLRGDSPCSANASKHRCSRGHLFTEENTFIDSRGKRNCRECWRIRARETLERHRERIKERKRNRYKRVVHEPRACSECGALFVPERSTKRYCSKEHQEKANQRNQYAKRKGIQPPP